MPKTQMVKRLSAWLFSVVMLGCSSGAGREVSETCQSHNSDDSAAACARFASLMCEYYFRCNVSFTSYWKTQDRCVVVHTGRCLSDTFQMPGSVQSSGQIWLAGRRYSPTTCAIQDTSQDKTCSEVGGSLEDGASCVYDYQCKSSRFCKKGSSTDTCGECSVLGVEGSECNEILDCEPELYCANDGCRKRVAIGQVCEEFGCTAGAVCIGNRCVEFHTTKLGDSCRLQADCLAGLVCENEVCREPVIPKEGESCTSYGGCGAGLGCVAGVCEKLAALVHCENSYGCAAWQYCNTEMLCVERLGFDAACTGAGDETGCERGLSCVESRCGYLTSEVCSPDSGASSFL